MQAEVVTAVPVQVESMKSALAPGGALAGWRKEAFFYLVDGEKRFQRSRLVNDPRTEGGLVCRSS
jgi:hypothetical protein